MNRAAEGENATALARDVKLARHWLETAAAAHLGLLFESDAFGAPDPAAMYREGRGVAKDFIQAKKWFLLAAEQGEPLAWVNLGLMAEQGQGGPKDEAVAQTWFQKAAEGGDKFAQNNLGVLLRDGIGVERNYSEAITWFKRSAAQGYLKAQLSLAQLYERMAGEKK